MMRSLIQFTTPKTPVGTFRVTVEPKVCQDDCETVVFEFLQFDSAAMRLEAFPEEGAQQSQEPIDVRLIGFPEFLGASAVTVNVSQGGTWAAGQVVDLVTDGAETTLSFIVPGTSFLLGEVSVMIDVGAVAAPVSFQLVLFDGLAERLVSTSPSRVPAFGDVSGRTLRYRSTVSFTVSNFPQDVAMDRISVFVGDLEATVQEVAHISTCAPLQVDCNVTEIEVLLPAMESFGSQQVTMYRDGVLVNKPYGSIRYVAGCDYDQLCGLNYPDFKQILRDASTTCNPIYCVDPNLVPPADVVPTGLAYGKTSGGHRIPIAFTNLPLLAASDIFVEFRIGGNVYTTSADSYQEVRGGSLAVNSGTFTVLSPAVGNSMIGFATVVVSVVYGSLSRIAEFSYEYLPVLTGNARVLSVVQPTVYATTAFQLIVTVANVERLPQPYNASKIRVALGGRPSVAASTILDSSVAETTFGVSGDPAGTSWPEGNLSCLVFMPSLGMARGGQFTVLVEPVPPAAAGAPFPFEGQSNEQYDIAVPISYLDPATTISDLTVSMAGASGPTDLTVVSLVQESQSCQFRECSKFELVISTPVANPDGSDVGSVTTITVSAGSQQVSFPFTYLANGAARIVQRLPTSEEVVMDAADQPEISIILANFPSATCKSTA
eukprot:892568-Rhodomonas_salina.1